MSYLRYLCLLVHSCVQHILCCVFVCLCLVYSMFPVSLDCLFWIAPLVILYVKCHHTHFFVVGNNRKFVFHVYLCKTQNKRFRLRMYYLINASILFYCRSGVNDCQTKTLSTVRSGVYNCLINLLLVSVGCI
jgi:hypothetical protein